ncbi:penicillin-binding transpeptidase domain-containing protein [Streptomyces sp. SL13]|uniref:Penicillin-binding transpeptidase domain-containing protein n=1 Tax=Streptantibioticus silvisoli TaxID=2705255 RepID=A0AA90H9R9_9ACTN|nr:penicillin-binding transpeptidase domain-containing protein [Streptantibioticus silvisoli]MDI5974466.1 penicillin-binding transpeptidase domain-containing protein [Streptantibioticus silvisoli]
MQRGAKRAAITGVCVVVVAGVGFGGYQLYTHETSDGTSVNSASGKVPTGPLTAAQVRSTANAFLAAWSSGDTAKAAGMTDDTAQASSQLTAFRTAFKATAVTAKATAPSTGASSAPSAAASTGTGTATASPDKVPFSVNASFTYNGQHTAWKYASALTVTRDSTTGEPVVAWAPSVVYPALKQGQTLEAGVTAPPPTEIVDRRGAVLTGAKYPSLSGILDQLRTRYGTKTQGTPSMAIEVKGSDGKAGTVLHALASGTPGKPLSTTIDATLQAEAERAVTTQGPDASVVSVQPSTGDILAVADNPAAGYNKAMLGQYASGSTFKVITASTLLSTGKYTPNSPLPCPSTITYGGRTFHNVEGENFANATTVATDFAASCNTAFISTANVLPDGAVEAEAKDVFGLGLTWNTGVSSWDGKVPAGTGSLKASTYIGQGEVQLNPLNMASVAATAKSGVFHQPIIVSPSLDHRTIAVAPRQLSPTVDSEIQSMMRLTARSGTAEPTIGTLSGDVGAKTGTAEVDGQTKPNSWFIAYRGDVAAAAVVPNTGDGYKYAGKIVTAILAAS